MKTATAPLPPLRSVKVLDQLRERIRYLHYSLPTEQAYVHWVRAFIRFRGSYHIAAKSAICIILSADFLIILTKTVIYVFCNKRSLIKNYQ